MVTATTPFKCAPLASINGVAHGFFTRQGGVSTGVFTSLNCGLGSGDDRAAVAENRTRAMAALGLGEPALATAYQVHSARVATVEAPFAADQRPEVDGLVTRKRNIALGVLAADCTPILLAGTRMPVIGAAHAGWRGALGGVIEATVEAMEALGAQRKDIVAAVGPTIAQASYEVGPEFPAPFLAQSPANADFFAPSPRQGHFLFDLPGYVVRRLAAIGLAAIDVIERDTYTEPGLFFSFRRSTHEGVRDYGRALSAIALA